MADRIKKLDIAEAAAKKRRRGRNIVLFLLVLILVLAAVLVAAYRDGTAMDALRRYFNYGSAGKAAGETLYTYNASSGNRYAAMDNRLVVLSELSLQLLSEDGGEVWSAPVEMGAPHLVQGGGRAVAYDVGGTELYVLGKDGLIGQLTADEEEPYISVTVNDKGWLAVTSEKRNNKGSAKVYDAALELVFEFKSANRFLETAWVTNDCGTLAAVALGQESGVFTSSVVLYDLARDDHLIGEYSIPDALTLDMAQEGTRLVTVTDTCLSAAGIDGSDRKSWSYGGFFLREYTLGGDGYTVLLLNRYQPAARGSW